ncbi:MAG: hypothetical protein ACJAQT_004341 [Akkermansiaceae bacterium]|jgi:hypothetical protein
MKKVILPLVLFVLGFMGARELSSRGEKVDRGGGRRFVKRGAGRGCGCRRMGVFRKVLRGG